MPKKIIKIAQKMQKQQNDPVIILANPQLGYNIGAVARVMANFDLWRWTKKFHFNGKNKK